MAKHKNKHRIQKTGPERVQRALQEMAQLSLQNAAVVEDACWSHLSACLSSLRFMAPRLARMRKLKKELRQHSLGGD